jgi:hypothetical protein
MIYLRFVPTQCVLISAWFVISVLFLFSAVQAQDHKPPESNPCGAPEAREFDFWIGSWDITQRIAQADGSWLELPASTRVVKDLDGCALVEHWEGEVQFFWEGMTRPEKMQGLSVRSYDPQEKLWRIYWMDTRHPKFATFDGVFQDGVGTFLKSSTTIDGKPLLTRIRFSEISSESVTWTLDVSRDNGNQWNPLWIMKMKLRISSDPDKSCSQVLHSG